MYLTLGVMAHVDAGKTTLCEQMLCHAGVIRRCGRVDHGDAFMDASRLERARGITIFCEQAGFSLGTEEGEPLEVTLMDTPGHVDFSGEAERALSVLDAALLVNPHDIDAMARTIAMALAMPAPERRLRWEAMMTKLRAGTIHQWFAEFVEALEDAHSLSDKSVVAAKPMFGGHAVRPLYSVGAGRLQ